MLIYVDIPNIGFCMIHAPSPSPPQDWSQLQSNAAQLSERQLQPLLRLAEQVTKASAVWYNVSGTKTCWQMSQEVRRLLWMVDILIYLGVSIYMYIYMHNIYIYMCICICICLCLCIIIYMV